jgi:hypothetical protein
VDRLHGRTSPGRKALSHFIGTTTLSIMTLSIIDTQHNDTQHNDIQHKNKKSETQYLDDTWHNSTRNSVMPSVANKPIIPSVVVLNVAKLSVLALFHLNAILSTCFFFSVTLVLLHEEQGVKKFRQGIGKWVVSS